MLQRPDPQKISTGNQSFVSMEQHEQMPWHCSLVGAILIMHVCLADTVKVNTSSFQPTVQTSSNEQYKVRYKLFSWWGPLLVFYQPMLLGPVYTVSLHSSGLLISWPAWWLGAGLSPGILWLYFKVRRPGLNGELRVRFRGCRTLDFFTTRAYVTFALTVRLETVSYTHLTLPTILRV